MTMNPLPPQAYTKDTLLKAYHWVQSQPPSIREMAMTPDILVSLYLKASRDGDHSLERPSIQNFKSELKSLAGLMGELDAPVKNTPPPPAATPSVEAPKPSFLGASAAPPLPSMPHFEPPPPPAPAPAMSAPVFTAPRVAPAATEAASPAPAAALGLTSLDSRSLELLKEIRHDFNLSSDLEALRMLIQIGSAKAKSLLKP